MNKHDAFIDNGTIAWSSSKKRLTLTSGIALYGPSLETKDTSFLQALEIQLRTALRSTSKDTLIRVQVSRHADFHGDLTDFHATTESLAKTEFTRSQRNADAVRFLEMNRDGKIKRYRINLFLQSTVTLPFRKARKKAHLQSLIDSYRTGIKQTLAPFQRALSQLGGHVTHLNNDGLHEALYRYVNPTCTQEEWEYAKEHLSPERSLFESLFRGDGVAVRETGIGFYCGGNYHGCVALSHLLQQTHSGLISQLTQAVGEGTTLTLNFQALDTATEITKAEQQKAKLERAREHSRQSRMDHARLTLENKIQAWTSGVYAPMRIQCVFHTAAASPEKLQENISVLSSALQLTAGAKPYIVSTPVTCRNLFFANAPGGPLDGEAFWHHVSDANAANLFPVSGDSVQSIKGAESLYLTYNKNLYGLKAFDIKDGERTPRHGFVTGMTGSGKSVFLVGLLTATDPFADFVVIIDDGLSYAGFIAAISNGQIKPLVLAVDSADTLNYLDTGGSPLSDLQITAVTNILHQMAGHKSDQDENTLRDAVLGRCVRLFYRHHAEQWIAHGPQRQADLVTLRTAILSYAQEYAISGGWVERHSAYTNWASDHPEEAEQLCAQASTTETPVDMQEIEADLLALAYNQMLAEDMPTHSDFHDWLEDYARTAERDRDELDRLVSLLEIWRKDRGIKGGLLDGVNSIDFSAKYLHIELGQIGEADPQLKSLAAYIIANRVRNEIMRRPRNERKQVIIEELGSFTSIPGGTQIVKDFYERSRKYNTFVISVIQAISSLSPELTQSIVSNCRQAYFFRQKEERDVLALQKAFRLPDVSVDIIRQFPEPSKSEGAPFVAWEDLGSQNRVTPCWNKVTPEMLYVAGTTGEQFEKRQKDLARYDSIIEAITVEANR